MLKNKLKRWLSAAVSAVMLCGMAGLLPIGTMRLTEPIVAEASQVDDVLAEARRWIGNTSYSGWCLQFVQDIFDNAGIHTDRKDAARDARDAWQINTGRDNIPPGAVVFFDNEFGIEYSDPANGPFGYWGHIEISTGGGNIIGSGGGAIQERAMNSYYWSHYTGWGWLGGIVLDDPLPIAPDPDASIASGKYQIVNVGTGKYFNHGYGWSGENLFYPAIAEPADGSPEQTFNINNVGDITYTVQSGYNSEFMNIWASEPSAIWLNQYVTFLKASNDKTQRFYFAPVGNGEYVIESAQNKDLVFGITVETYNRDFQMIKLQKYNKSDANQRWKFIRLDAPPIDPPIDSLSPDPDASIASGKYQIVNVGTGNYFNHGYGWRGENLFYPAIAEPADGSPEQTFNINNVSGITYTVQSGYNSEFMNIWAGTPSEIGLDQYVTFLNASNDNTQRFYFAPVGNGEYVIESAENKKLVFGITVESYNRDFQMIKLQKYNKSDANQRWKFIRLDAPSIDPPVDPDPPTVKTDLVYGVDISAFQGDVDWNALEHSGIDFAILRTGTTLSKDNNSEYYWDSRIDKNYAGAKETKLKLGAYYYCGATTEADFINCAYGFLDHIKGKEFEYPVYIDLENDPSGDTTQRDLGKEKLTSYVISALTIIRNRGYRAGVYANLNWFNNYLDADAIKAAGFEIWLAQYPSASAAVDPTQYDKSDFGGMWQYSSLGSINGISGNVDLDVSYIKYDELPPVEAQQVKGDCNDDGSFTIADAVLIHKWLVTIPDVKLANWEAGDMNGDGKLDVRDLTLMKQALLKQ